LREEKERRNGPERKKVLERRLFIPQKGDLPGKREGKASGREGAFSRRNSEFLKERHRKGRGRSPLVRGGRPSLH